MRKANFGDPLKKISYKKPPVYECKGHTGTVFSKLAEFTQNFPRHDCVRVCVCVFSGRRLPDISAALWLDVALKKSVSAAVSKDKGPGFSIYTKKGQTEQINGGAGAEYILRPHVAPVHMIEISSKTSHFKRLP